MKSIKLQERISNYILDKPSTWIDQAEKYEVEKDWLDKSAMIAIKILSTLKSQSISQKELAESVGVSPQYINKVVKGRENLSLETICKIEDILGITLISVPEYEKSQVITNSLLVSSIAISRNQSQEIGSDEMEYKPESFYEPYESELAVA